MKLPINLIIFLALMLFALTCKKPPMEPKMELGAPSKLKIQALSDTVISLSWEYPTQSQVNFCIERAQENMGFIKVGVVPPNVTVFNDAAMFKTNVKYYYRVNACTDKNQGDFVHGEIFLAFQKPTNLIIIPQSKSKIKLQWKDESNFETGFVIDRKSLNGSYSEVGRTGKNDQVFIDETARSSDMGYTYKVYAYTAHNSTDFSEEKEISWGKNKYGFSYFEHLILSNVSPNITCVASNPNGHVLAIGYSDGTVRLRDVITGHLNNTLLAHTSSVSTLSFNSDETILLSSSGLSTKVWNAKTGQAICGLTGKGMDISPNGSLVATSSEDDIFLWDATTCDKVSTLAGNTIYGNSTINHLLFSPDGKLLASATTQEDNIKLWKLSSGTYSIIIRAVFFPHEVTAINFNPNSALLATATWDDFFRDDITLKLWNVKDGTENRVLRTGYQRVSSIAFSPDGELLASAYSPNTIDIWHVGSGNLVYTLSDYSTQITFASLEPNVFVLCAGHSLLGFTKNDGWVITP